MKRKLSLLVVLLLLVPTGVSCSFADVLAPDTTLPIPDDPRVRAVVEILRPSVVEVRATAERGALIQEVGLGTGVILEADGLIVTNDHVITLGGPQGGSESREPAGRIEVRLHSGDRLRATVVGRVPGRDLAFLDVDETGLPAAALISNLDEVDEGELAVAIGAAPNLEQPVTVGQVTGVLRNVRSPTLPELRVLIRSNVPLDQGNSGGPLADEEGRVMGINVAVTIGTAGAGQAGGSLAIPATEVQRALEELEGVSADR